MRYVETVMQTLVNKKNHILRQVLVFPAISDDKSRPYLSTRYSKGNDYINAVFVDVSMTLYEHSYLNIHVHRLESQLPNIADVHMHVLCGILLLLILLLSPSSSSSSSFHTYRYCGIILCSSFYDRH